MHPLFSSKSGLYSYLAAWFAFGLMLSFLLIPVGHLTGVESIAVTIPLVLMLAVVCLWPWYSCRSAPLNSARPWKVLSTHLFAAILISALLPAAIRLAVFELRGTFPQLGTRFHLALPAISGMVFMVYLLSVALHYVLLAFESSRRAELLSRDAELKALKAQVNPHFLFNCLNSISALTTADPAKAREMCIRLSDFLRSSLRLGERVAIPFSEELALTNTYLEVEQVRFGARLHVIRDIDARCRSCDVPPLIVQPLVENAIKHGIATLVEGGEIVIRGRRLPKSFSIVIENRFDPEAPAARRNGFGLVSVRNRLQARYGAAARLDIQVEESQYRVVLTVPCSPALEESKL